MVDATIINDWRYRTYPQFVRQLFDKGLTSGQTERAHLLSPMSIEPISVRDFLRNFASIVKSTKRKKYLIMKHGKPIGMFTPWNIVKEETLPEGESPWSILEKL